jgi:hypothetical protein
VPSANKTDGTMECRLAVEDTIGCKCTVVIVDNNDNDDDDKGQAWITLLPQRHGTNDTATNFDKIRDVECSSGRAMENADVIGISRGS